MKSKFFLILLLCPFLLFNCSSAGSSSNQDKPVKVAITTSLGDIEVELYDQTPQHRDNFVKLVKEGYYNGILFHRVIKNFMIQAGDPNSKNAKKETHLGSGGPGYTIPAEFVPGLIHKRGVLSAARLPDGVNPGKESSGSQFYIVQGEKFTDEGLDDFEAQTIGVKTQQIFVKYLKEEEEAAKKAGQKIDVEKIHEKARERANAYMEEHPYKMKEEDRQTYKTIGGTPHLDGAYTIFGEVTKGMDVVDKIAAVQTTGADRPVTDVKIIKMKIIK
ncbi:MAG: peptidylprolyl isomerase [Bacteroidales bacterium]|jgi:cyclophilin family peptidyl-prolyl cis-trans isomerase|nr:peptidylprolyl isomerase [Bacteroidales bacterium]